MKSLLSTNTPVSSELLAVDVSIQSTGNGRYSLNLHANGQMRSLAGVSCTKVAEAAALLIALLLDPNLADSGGMASSSTRAAQSQHSRAEPTESAAASRLAALVEIAGRLDIGTWPKLEPAVVAGIGLEGTGWRLLAHAGFGRQIPLRTEQNSNLAVVPITLNIEPAIKLSYRRWSLEPGVGVELGINHSRSNDLLPQRHDALSLLLCALLRGTRELGASLGVWAQIGGGIPLLRPRWLGPNDAVFHEFGPLIRVEFGVQTRF